MPWAHRLNTLEIAAATDKIVILMGLYLGMCAYMALVIAKKLPRGQDTADTAREAIQVWGAMASIPALILAGALLHDVASLAVTFPIWGLWLGLLLLAALWIVARFFSLNTDSVGDYSIQAGLRVTADVKWTCESSGKEILVRALIAWMVGIGIAIAWLLTLSGRSLLSYFG